MNQGPMSFLNKITEARSRNAKSSESEPLAKKPRTEESFLPSDFLQALGHYLMARVPLVANNAPSSAGENAGPAAKAPNVPNLMQGHRASTGKREMSAKNEDVETSSPRHASSKPLEHPQRLAQLQPMPEVARAPGATEPSAAERTDAKSILLSQPALDDPSLRVSVMPQAAHINIETGGAGDLSLHLRVKDGVADVRLEGAATPLLVPRTDELRVVLATQGIALGSFDVSQDGNSKNEQAYQTREELSEVRSQFQPSASSDTTDSESARAARTGIVNIKA